MIALRSSLERCCQLIRSHTNRNSTLRGSFCTAAMSNKSVENIISKHDPIQVQYLNEECLLVNEQDEVIGSATKKECHLLENIDKGMLHRAFSVFLFNSRNELLLQQRSESKITYPAHFTNTCCSHPLNRELERDGLEGVKVAARRKLDHELGIKPDEMPLDAFRYLTRIQYKSRNVPDDGTFGEHEIDYILFAKRDVTVRPNANEVMSYKYVSQEELKRFIDDSDKNGTSLVTPWFRLIVDSKLDQWWKDLENLDRHEDHQTIHRF